MTEMTKLAVLLAKNDIPFDLVAPNRFGIQIIAPSVEHRQMDAVCHAGSYGGPEGFLEIMINDPAFEEENGDQVVGWLTAEDALPFFQKWAK